MSQNHEYHSHLPSDLCLPLSIFPSQVSPAPTPRTPTPIPIANQAHGSTVNSSSEAVTPYMYNF